MEDKCVAGHTLSVWCLRECTDCLTFKKCVHQKLLRCFSWVFLQSNSSLACEMQSTAIKTVKIITDTPLNLGRADNKRKNQKCKEKCSMFALGCIIERLYSVSFDSGKSEQLETDMGRVSSVSDVHI